MNDDEYSVISNLHGKNDFAEIFKNLDTDLKMILLDHQNNYVRNSSMMSNDAKNFYILATSLNVAHNYFDSLIILFSDLFV